MSKPHEALDGRGVALGRSLIWELDRRALLRGSSRSREARRYIELALDARRLLPRTPDRYLDDRTRGEGRATLWLPADAWVQVEATAARAQTSMSEAARLLIYGGLALAAPEPDCPTEEEARARALRLLATPRTCEEFARAMWPRARSGRSGAARRLLLGLGDAVERLPGRSWREPTLWGLKGDPALQRKRDDTSERTP